MWLFIWVFEFEFKCSRLHTKSANWYAVFSASTGPVILGPRFTFTVQNREAAAAPDNRSAVCGRAGQLMTSPGRRAAPRPNARVPHSLCAVLAGRKTHLMPTSSKQFSSKCLEQK